MLVRCGSKANEIEVHEGRCVDTYTVAEIPTDIGGRGFRIEKYDGIAYHLLWHRKRHYECECLGFLRWGYCRHGEVVGRWMETHENPR